MELEIGFVPLSMVVQSNTHGRVMVLFIEPKVEYCGTLVSAGGFQ